MQKGEDTMKKQMKKKVEKFVKTMALRAANESVYGSFTLGVYDYSADGEVRKILDKLAKK